MGQDLGVTMSWRILAVGAAILAAATSARAVTDANFELRSGADLVALCGVAKDDPLRSAALQMCEGYGVGVYQAILALTTHKGLQPLFCPPDPPPERNEVIAQFVEWSKKNTQYQSDRPVDFLGRFLVEVWPCPKDAKPAPRGAK
jgi:hypothetical protein